MSFLSGLAHALNPISAFSGGGSITQKLQNGFNDVFNPLGAALGKDPNQEIFNAFHPASPSSSAADTLASIANSEWDSYKQNFYPVEDALTQMVNNPGYNQQQVGLNVASYNAQSKAADEGFQQNLGRLGVQMTGPQEQAYNRYKNISDTLGQTEAANRTQMGLQQQSNDIIGGGTTPTVLGKLNTGVGLPSV